MKALFLTMLFFGIVQVNDNCGKMGSSERNKNLSATPTKKGEAWRSEHLPADINPETKVRSGNEITTVANKLNELNARFEDGNLIDGKGREIRLFSPLCRGVSQGPEEDEEARKAKEKELSELEKKFTVIILYCDPASVM